MCTIRFSQLHVLYHCEQTGHKPGACPRILCTQTEQSLIISTTYATYSARPISRILTLYQDKIAFDWTNCLMNNIKIKNSNLTARLIISQEQSWPMVTSIYNVVLVFLDKVHNLLVKYCFVQMFLLDTFKNYFMH